MIKKIISLFVVIILLSACVFLILDKKNNDTSAVYAIKSYSNNNVFVLQINKKQQQIDLYRKQNNGSLLRYRISDNTFTKETIKNNSWEVQTTAELAHSPFLLAEEIRLLLKGKSNDTSYIKEFLDLLLSAFSTVYTDSEILIDYTALPNAAEQLTDLIKNKDERETMKFNKRISKANVIYSISPFSDAYMTEQIVEIISSVVQYEYREDIFEALFKSCDSLTDYKFQVSTNLQGAFKGLEIYNNQNIIFSVNKLK